MKALWIIGGILLLLVLLSLVRVGAVLSFGEELRIRLRLGPDLPPFFWAFTNPIWIR